LVLIGTAVALGCGKADESAHENTGPATVAHHVEEKGLNTITLTEKAEQRLGIQLAEVQFIDVQQKRTFGGEVVVPPGQTIIVSAPIAGTLLAPEDHELPLAGSRVAVGQPVFRFQPLLTPERDVLTPAERIRVAQTKADITTAQIEAERQVESAKLQVEAAQIAYDRAVQLLKIKAGSQRNVDEAETRLKLAREAQQTAEARYEFLSAVRLDEEAGELNSRTIVAPVAGVLQSIDAAPGQTVAAGEALFQVVRINRVWIRVPIYVGQWRQVDTEAGAAIAEYGRPPAAPARVAQYVSAPPSANPDTTTVDLFFEIANDDGMLYPGLKLAATVAMQSRARSLVVPFTAILYDIQGGAWVYEQIGPRRYARRRVAVRYVDAPNAVLAMGPEPGVKVVTEGAAELFGTEFGVGH
jgi:RND family efflux transporter MFP subunit